MAGKVNRIAFLKGSPREVGIAAGRRLGRRLAENIDYYIRNRPYRPEDLDRVRLHSEALPRLRTLPPRFQEELEGLAEGAGLPLQCVAEWYAVENYVQDSCSAFAVTIGDHTWVGRNNDLRAPEVWGFVTVKHVKDRIPTITFGMEADVFTGTGINREQLWLHSHYLPISDSPRPDREHYAGYVVLTEALETCSTIDDVSRLLSTIDRDAGILLFAVDGKSGEAVVFECSCREHRIRYPVDNRLVATNHCDTIDPALIAGSSANRFKRLTELVGENDWSDVCTPDDLIVILADGKVEQRDDKYITVESAVACPAEKKLWYTLGGCPAASKGNWMLIDWPWEAY